MNELLTQLAAPFAPSAITWKPGASKENKCMAMAYADLRAYMERLDDICGMEWTVKYEPWGDNRIIAHLTIAGVTRCSTGEMEAQDEKSGIGGTVAEAQAFKRAAAMFGLGRYLYDLPSVWVEFDAQRKRITEAGQAELNSRYKAWYAKKMAVQKPSPSGGQQVDDSIFDTDSGPEGTRPKKPNLLSQAQMTRLHVLGTDLHGKRWDAERAKLVAEVSNGTYSSCKELSPQEAQVLIAHLEAELKHAHTNGHKQAA